MDSDPDPVPNLRGTRTVFLFAVFKSLMWMDHGKTCRKTDISRYCYFKFFPKERNIFTRSQWLYSMTVTQNTVKNIHFFNKLEGRPLTENLKEKREGEA